MTDPVSLAQKFCAGDYTNNVEDSLWEKAFEYLVANLNLIQFDKEKIHLLWTVNGGYLRRKIRNDKLIRSVLRHALPGYQGPGITLYRGECRFLYEKKKIGFCWSPDIIVARQFAQGPNAMESGGVLLEAFAPEEAILAGPNQHSSVWLRESEYTCDPDQMREIRVIEVFEKSFS